MTAAAINHEIKSAIETELQKIISIAIAKPEFDVSVCVRKDFCMASCKGFDTVIFTKMDLDALKELEDLAEKMETYDGKEHTGTEERV